MRSTDTAHEHGQQSICLPIRDLCCQRYATTTQPAQAVVSPLSKASLLHVVCQQIRKVSADMWCVHRQGKLTAQETPEGSSQALVPFDPAAGEAAALAAQSSKPGSEARGRMQQRVFENGFLAAKMSRAAKLHTLMAQLVGGSDPTMFLVSAVVFLPVYARSGLMAADGWREESQKKRWVHDDAGREWSGTGDG